MGYEKVIFTIKTTKLSFVNDENVIAIPPSTLSFQGGKEKAVWVNCDGRYRSGWFLRSQLKMQRE